MKNIFEKYPWLEYFAKIYVYNLSIFFLFRVILLVTNLEQIEQIAENKIGLILSVFLMGIRFDISITGYFVLLSFLLIFISTVFKQKTKIIYYISSIVIAILTTIGFFIATADIPYYNQFGSRFTNAAFKWFDSFDFVMKMIIEEPRYIAFSIPLLLIIALNVYFLKRITVTATHKIKSDKTNIKAYLSEIGLFIIAFFLILLGIRGRIEEKSPIRISTAYITNYPFFNQLGLNPNFTFFQSVLNSTKTESKEIKLVEYSDAIKYVENDLGARFDSLNNCFIREIVTGVNNNYNVIFIIMEGVSGDVLTGNNKYLMPFLDSIKHHSIYFPNFYSTGIHTNNGIFSTQTSLPVLFNRNMMTEMVKIPDFGGIASILKHHKYSTIFSLTHDDEFDGMKGFLIANGYDKVVSKKDYPIDKVLSTMGVPDNVLFDYSLPIITKIKKEGKPLLYTFLTGTNHGPYIIPKGTDFVPTSKEIKKQTIEFTDWAIRKFISNLSNQKWFDSTIVVITSDHGSIGNKEYDIPLSYLHIPLIIYSPKLLKPQVIERIGSQIDIMPTVMSLLGLNYTNRSFGIDLINNKREYLYFCFDNIGGVLNDSLLYIYHPQNTDKLHKYMNGNKKDYKFEYANEFSKMENYFKNYITANYYYYTKKQE